ncbi:dipeptidase PepV [Lacticaseibacillus mingshuiensis]|uniref:Dipeptidase PepV n=1 Tax=Lacticaseibacillus mingshuiensis TaxID=2799574 RepID=A0ABW4CDV4_9LACO|nr:dipeptidase PepV [Lacticaseibacillus mingshuiensis]
MTIDWQKEAEGYQDDLLRDLFTLLKIDSVRDVEHKTDTAPLGPGPAEALKQMLALGQRDGFKTLNVDNVAGRIEYGDGDEIFGLFGHMDVVPAGPGWQTDPFAPEIKDGKLYARGSSDDKGPSIAAYYALKMIKDLGLPVNKKIHFIIGTDEESEWVGINRYLETEPAPDFGFSPDAEFPIINGEKGIATFLVSFAKQAPAPTSMTLNRFEAGVRVNMVPQEATATISGTLPGTFEHELAQFAAAQNVTVNTQPVAGGLTITMTGKGAHAQEPKDGINAATFLATFLAPYPFDPAGKTYLTAIATKMHSDSRGSRLGINYTDKVMGELTASPDLFNFTQDGPQTIAINVRYPQGTDADKIRDQIETALAPDDVEVTINGHAQPPHYVAGDDPLVQTLLAVYTEQTGKPGHEQVIGGGTYGRIIKRGVAFGAQMEGQENVMHQANEYMPVKDIIKAVAIYAEAISRLVK